MPETATPTTRPEVATPAPKAPASGPEAPAPDAAPAADVQRLLGALRPGAAGGSGATPPPPPPPRWSSRASGFPRELAALQRMAGNRAVAGLVTKSRFLTPVQTQVPGGPTVTSRAIAPAPVQRRTGSPGLARPDASAPQRGPAPTVQREDPKKAPPPADPKKDKQPDQDPEPEELYVFAATVDNAAKVFGQLTSQLKDKTGGPLDLLIIGLDATFLRVYDRKGDPTGPAIPLQLPKELHFNPGIYVIPPGGGPSRRLRLDPKSGRVGIYEVAGLLVDKDPKKAKEQADAGQSAGSSAAGSSATGKGSKAKQQDLEDVGKTATDGAGAGPAVFDLRKYMKDTSALDALSSTHKGAGQFFVVPHPLTGGSGKGKGGARTTGFAGELEGKGPPPNAPPWPVNMDGPKLQPADSEGVFSARINWGANGNNSSQAQTFAAIGNSIHYRWEVFDVTAFAKRQAAATERQARQTQALIKAATEKGVATDVQGTGMAKGVAVAGGGDGAAGGGATTGPATGADAQPVTPAPPDPDAHALDDAVDRGTKARAGSGMDPQADTRNRKFRRSFEELWDDTKRASNDLDRPTGSTMAERQSNAQANLLAIELLPVSFVITALGSTLRWFADLFSGDASDQEIHFEKEGVYLVRVITTPAVTTDRDGKDVIRPSSVASKIVEVKSMSAVLKESLDEPGAQLAEAKKRADDLAKNATTDAAKKAAQEAKDAYDLKELEVNGDPVKFLEKKLELRNKDLDAAKAKWQGIAVGPIYEIERDIETIENRLKVYRLQNQRRGTGDMITPPQRVNASLVSEVTGQTYPLLLTVGPMKDDEKGRKVWKLMDATGQDAEGFTGYGTTELDAIKDAFRQFGNKAGYGRGRIGVRMPDTITPIGAGPGKEFELDSKPLGWAIAKARIDDLVMTLAAIGLFVASAGTASIVIGAAVAAARLIERAYNGTLRFDAAAVSDVLAILGAAGAAGHAIAGLRVASAGIRFEAVGKEFAVMVEEGAAVSTADLAKASKAMESAASVMKGVEMANEIINYAGVVWGNVTFFNDMLEVAALEAQGPPGGITHAEARRRRAVGIAGAINNNGMVIAPHVIKGIKAKKAAAKAKAAVEAGGAKPSEHTGGTAEHASQPGERSGPRDEAAATEGSKAEKRQPASNEEAGKPSDSSSAPKDTVPGGHPGPGEPGHAGDFSTTASGKVKGDAAGKTPRTPKKGSAAERAGAHTSLIEAARTGEGLDAAARDAIGKGGTWKEQLKGALGKLEGKQRRAAEDALVKARDTIVNDAWKKVQDSDARFKKLTLENTGTKSFSSDVDATVRPKQEAQTTGHELSEQVKDAADAAKALSKELRNAVGGETDALIDTNIYSFIGEGKVTPSPTDAAGKGAQSHVDMMVGLAEQLRGQSAAEFKAFEKRMTERVSDPRVQQEVKRIIGQAREFNTARQAEWSGALADAKAKAPHEPQATHERMAREALLDTKKQELGKLLGAEKPDFDAIARKQSEINWFAPDAYATPSAFKQAVAHGQRLKGTRRSTAEWTGNDVAAKLREAAGKLKPDDPRAAKLKREASLAESQQSTLTEIEKDLRKAHENAPVDQAAVKELEEQANGLRKEISRAAERVAIAEILDITTPGSGAEKLSNSAAASAANTGMMEAHVKHAKDIDSKVKAAAKYAGRIAMAEKLSGMRPALDPIARLVGEFVKGRWGIFEDVSPQIMRDMFVRYARLRGMHTELAYNERGEAIGATDKLKQAFVDDVLSWGRSTNDEVQGSALTSKAYDNPTPAPAAPPPAAGEPATKGRPAPDSPSPGAGKPLEGAGAKESSGARDESAPHVEEQAKPSSPHEITSSGSITESRETPVLDPPGEHQLFDFRLSSLREADTVLRRLANGDPKALAEQGVKLPDGYKSQGREFGLAQLPDGSYAIVQGDPGGVTWSALPKGSIPLAHTHPITPEKALSAPGTIKEILENYGKPADHPSDPTPPRSHDAAHVAPSPEDILFCAANRVVNHDVHTGYVHTGDGILKMPTGAANEMPVSFNIAEAKHIGDAGSSPVVEAIVVAHDSKGNKLWEGRMWASNWHGEPTLSMTHDTFPVDGPPDPQNLRGMHGSTPAGPDTATPGGAGTTTTKAGSKLPPGMGATEKGGGTKVALGGDERVAGGTIVEKDDFSVTVKARKDPNALVRIEPDGQSLKLTDIFRKSMPPGTGVLLLAEALQAVHAGPGFELIIHGIINPETLEALEKGMNPLESKLGKTAERALAAIGLTPKNARWETIRGKQCIVMDID